MAKTRVMTRAFAEETYCKKAYAVIMRGEGFCLPMCRRLDNERGYLWLNAFSHHEALPAPGEWDKSLPTRLREKLKPLGFRLTFRHRHIGYIHIHHTTNFLQIID